MGAYFFTREANIRHDSSVERQNQAVVSQLQQSGTSIAEIKTEVAGLSSKVDAHQDDVKQLSSATNESKLAFETFVAKLETLNPPVRSNRAVTPGSLVEPASNPFGATLAPAYPVSFNGRPYPGSPFDMGEDLLLHSLERLVDETDVLSSEERSRFAKALKKALGCPKERRLDFAARLLSAAQQKDAEQRATTLNGIEGEIEVESKKPVVHPSDLP